MDYQQEQKRIRVARAVYLSYVEGLEQNEIAERLDVSQTAVSNYLNDEATEVLHEHLREHAAHIRLSTLEELRNQLQDAIDRANGAEELTEDWDTGEDGQVETVVDMDEDGRITNREPLPSGFSLEPDYDARADARKEIREILKDMQEVAGVSDTFAFEFSPGGDGGQRVEINTSVFGDESEDESDDEASTDGGEPETYNPDNADTADNAGGTDNTDNTDISW